MSSLSLHYSQMTVSIIVNTLNHSRHRRRHDYTGHHLLSPLTSRPWNLSSLSPTRRHFNLLHPYHHRYHHPYHHRCNHHHQNLVFTVLLPPTLPTSLTIGFVLLFNFFVFNLITLVFRHCALQLNYMLVTYYPSVVTRQPLNAFQISLLGYRRTSYCIGGLEDWIRDSVKKRYSTAVKYLANQTARLSQRLYILLLSFVFTRHEISQLAERTLPKVYNRWALRSC